MPRLLAIVTGANSGIGQWIALGLAQAEYDVLAVGRNPKRLAALNQWITASTGRPPIIEPADLSLLSGTVSLAKRILARGQPVALLVNNAGIYAGRRMLTSEGREQVLATNHLSPFLLTSWLRPAMAEAARGALGRTRIVNIGSSTADHAAIDPDDLELARGWGAVRAYRRSKLALLMQSIDWAEQLQPDGITVNVAHPGMVATSLIRTRSPASLAWRLMSPFLLTPEQGAETPLFLALAPAPDPVTGGYFKRCRSVAANPLALDAGLRKKVRQRTEQLAAGFHFSPAASPDATRADVPA